MDHEPQEVLSLWQDCAAKWTVNCKDIGCCADASMTCFQKDEAWSACKETCEAKDEKNEAWTCLPVHLPEPRSAEICRVRCQERNWCRQAIFDSQGPGSCKLYKTHGARVVWAGDNFHTMFCGLKHELPQMQ